MYEMQIVSAPELDYVPPRLVAIPLRANPLVLLVPRKNEIVRELRADKALMIIGCRIYQVTEDLDWRPVVVGVFTTASIFGNVFQTRRPAHDGFAEIS